VLLVPLPVALALAVQCGEVQCATAMPVALSCSGTVTQAASGSATSNGTARGSRAESPGPHWRCSGRSSLTFNLTLPVDSEVSKH
jgi:hypothetical protein